MVIRQTYSYVLLHKSLGAGEEARPVIFICVLTSCRSVVSRTEYSAVPREEARQIAALRLFALSGRKTGRTEIMFHGVLATAAIHSGLFDQGEYQAVESRI